MAASPPFKVFDGSGTYQAACKEVEAAAALAAFYGDGTTIRMGHSRTMTVWTEGVDGAAGESYDDVAELVADRLRRWRDPLGAGRRNRGLE